MSIKAAALSGVAAGLLALTGACAQTPLRTDHHVHVHAPEILDYLPDYCASPARLGPCDPSFVHPYTPADLLAEMDEAGIDRAFLMSSGYLAESPMMSPPRPDAAELLHLANVFTVELAGEHPDRISAFIGLNPLTDTARAELEFWRGDPRVAGVKLHLTNSDVDLRDPAQVAQLAGVFAAAAQARMAIMIHMRTRAEDYGRRDVSIFLEQVLPHADGVPVIVAHSGGWGGLDDNTWDALEGFAEHRETYASANLWFDLAQVLDLGTPSADLVRLERLMRKVGVERFVAGSDWPFSGNLRTYLDKTYGRLDLTPEARDALFTRDILR